MVFLIVFSCVVTAIASLSIYLNYVLYKRYDSLSTFFNSIEDEILKDYSFFDKLCQTHLLMNDDFVVDLIGRLRKMNIRFSQYTEKIKDYKL